MDTKTKISDEQAAAMTSEVRLLLEQAGNQLEEHKTYLLTEMAALEPSVYGLTHESLTDLMREVQDIQLSLVQSEPAIKEGASLTVSVVYDYPDGIHEFLQREDVPAALRASLTNGILLSDKPTIVQA